MIYLVLGKPSTYEWPIELSRVLLVRLLFLSCMNSPTSIVPKSSVTCYQSPPQVHTLSQMNPIHTLLSYFFKFHFNVSFLHQHLNPSVSSFRFSDLKSICTFHLSHARHIPYLFNYEYTQVTLIYTDLYDTLARIISKKLGFNYQLKFVYINKFTV
jgi:hypothetical protein